MNLTSNIKQDLMDYATVVGTVPLWLGCSALMKLQLATAYGVQNAFKIIAILNY